MGYFRNQLSSDEERNFRQLFERRVFEEKRQFPYANFLYGMQFATKAEGDRKIFDAAVYQTPSKLADYINSHASVTGSRDANAMTYAFGYLNEIDPHEAQRIVENLNYGLATRDPELQKLVASVMIDKAAEEFSSNPSHGFRADPERGFTLISRTLSYGDTSDKSAVTDEQLRRAAQTLVDYLKRGDVSQLNGRRDIVELLAKAGRAVLPSDDRRVDISRALYILARNNMMQDPQLGATAALYAAYHSPEGSEQKIRSLNLLRFGIDEALVNIGSGDRITFQYRLTENLDGRELKESHDWSQAWRRHEVFGVLREKDLIHPLLRDLGMTEGDVKGTLKAIQDANLRAERAEQRLADYLSESEIRRRASAARSLRRRSGGMPPRLNS